MPSYFFLLLVFLIIVDFILCCDLLSIYCAAVVLALCAVLLLFMTVFLVMLLHSGFFSHHRARTKTVARMRLFCINKKLFLRIFFSHFCDCLVKRHFVYWNLFTFCSYFINKKFTFCSYFFGEAGSHKESHFWDRIGEAAPRGKRSHKFGKKSVGQNAQKSLIKLCKMENFLQLGA